MGTVGLRARTLPQMPIRRAWRVLRWPAELRLGHRLLPRLRAARQPLHWWSRTYPIRDSQVPPRHAVPADAHSPITAAADAGEFTYGGWGWSLPRKLPELEAVLQELGE